MFYALHRFVLLESCMIHLGRQCLCLCVRVCVVGGTFLFSFASPNKAKLSREGMQANAGMINTAVGYGGNTHGTGQTGYEED